MERIQRIHLVSFQLWHFWSPPTVQSSSDVKATNPHLSIDVFRIGLTRKTELVAIAFPDIASMDIR
jgi:hypothetical protein